jgi:hypothetical protein
VSNQASTGAGSERVAGVSPSGRFVAIDRLLQPNLDLRGDKRGFNPLAPLNKKPGYRDVLRLRAADDAGTNRSSASLWALQCLLRVKAGGMLPADETPAFRRGCRVKSFAETCAACAVTAGEAVGSDAAEPAGCVERQVSAFQTPPLVVLW